MKMKTFRQIFELSIPLFISAYIQFEYLRDVSPINVFLFGIFLFAVLHSATRLIYKHYIRGLEHYNVTVAVNINRVGIIRNIFFIGILPVTLLLYYSPGFENIRLMNDILISAIIVCTLVFSLCSVYIFINVLVLRKLSA